MDAMGETRVTVEFTDLGRQTRLDIVHDGLPGDEARENLQEGLTGTLDRLVAVDVLGSFVPAVKARTLDVRAFFFKLKLVPLRTRGSSSLQGWPPVAGHWRAHACRA